MQTLILCFSEFGIKVMSTFLSSPRFKPVFISPKHFNMLEPPPNPGPKYSPRNPGKPKGRKSSMGTPRRRRAISPRLASPAPNACKIFLTDCNSCLASPISLLAYNTVSDTTVIFPSTHPPYADQPGDRLTKRRVLAAISPRV